MPPPASPPPRLFASLRTLRRSKANELIARIACCAFLAALTCCTANNRPYWQGDWKLADAKVYQCDGKGQEKYKYKHRATHQYAKHELHPQSLDDTVTVIEFDDQGDFWDRTQLGLAIQRITASKRTKRPPLLVTYVHGWHNNANPNLKPGDYHRFKEFAETMKLKYPARNVVAVFMGWRGESSNIPIVRQLTFWNRAEGASRVAEGSIVYAVNRLGAETRALNGKSVIIGHSFGGRIVEKVYSKHLIANGWPNIGRQKKRELPADLAILINPATEALHARRIQLALHTKPTEPPAMIAIGAKNDTPNAHLWPLGANLKNTLGLGFLKEPDRQYMYYPKPGITIEPESQFSDYIARTTANTESLFTHSLVEENDENEGGDLLRVGDKKYRFDLLRDRKFSIPNPEANPLLYGYWIFQVPNEILTGHGNDANDKKLGVLSVAMKHLVLEMIRESKAL